MSKTLVGERHRIRGLVVLHEDVLDGRALIAIESQDGGKVDGAVADVDLTTEVVRTDRLVLRLSGIIDENANLAPLASARAAEIRLELDHHGAEREEEARSLGPSAAVVEMVRGVGEPPAAGGPSRVIGWTL